MSGATAPESGRSVTVAPAVDPHDAERAAQVDGQALLLTIASATGQPKRAVHEMMAALSEHVRTCVAHGQEVTLPGLGTFCMQHRRGGKGMNFATGERMQLSAQAVPRFVATTSFRRLVRDAASREGSGQASA